VELSPLGIVSQACFGVSDHLSRGGSANFGHAAWLATLRRRETHHHDVGIGDTPFDFSHFLEIRSNIHLAWSPVSMGSGFLPEPGRS
jgi:hypothetical protein